MPIKVIQIRCSNCKSVMNFQWDGTALNKKRKRCVYCGKSFNIKKI